MQKGLWISAVLCGSFALLQGCGGSAGGSTPPAAVVAQFAVSVSAGTVTAGNAMSVTVSALDTTGAVVGSYRGTVHFASTDSQAVLPNDAKLSNGTGTFSVTLKTSGGQRIAVSDAVSSSIGGQSSLITVNPGTQTNLGVAVPANAAVGTAFNFSVTAVDAYGNTVNSSSEAVKFSSTDPQAVLPVNAALAAGTGTFSATFKTAGNQTITVTDAVTAAITGTSTAVNVIVSTLAITSGPLPGGIVGSPYGPLQATIHCSIIQICKIYFVKIFAGGGSGNYSWSLTPAAGSSVPSGIKCCNLTIQHGFPGPIGETSYFPVIYGTPTAAGNYEVVLTVKDNATQAQASKTYEIGITAPPPPPAPVINTVPGPAGATLNQPYNFAFTATGGAPPLNWSETGAMPPGLSFDNGIVSGTATSLGSYPITLNVQDGNGQNAASQNFTLQVFAHGFGLTGSMQTARLIHTATLLSNGEVLVTGGQQDITHVYATAELFNPATATFTSTGSMEISRAQHTATLLCDLSAPSCADKRVLVAGGESVSDGNAVASAELFDPTTGMFSATGTMGMARYWHTATLLQNGKVLIAGGTDASNNGTASAELYDPASGTFTVTGDMTVARTGHTATLLANGMVLVTGGLVANLNGLASAELYDPASGQFTAAGNMTIPRGAPTATLLASGKVLITGGATDNNGNPSAAAELFDPATNTFSATGNMVVARTGHTATLLNDGTVLLAGGDGNGVFLNSSELFDPIAGTFQLTGGMQSPRIYHTMTLLSNGTALVTGGVGTGPAVSSAEIYK